MFLLSVVFLLSVEFCSANINKTISNIINLV